MQWKDNTTLPSRGLCLSNNRCHPIQTLFPIASALVRAPSYVLQGRRKVSPAVWVITKRKLGTCRGFEVPHSAELLGRYGSDAGLLMRAWGSGPSKLRKRPPASRSNPHADDFDPAPADDHAVDGRRREPSVDQLDQQLGLEPVGQHDRLGAAVDGCLKQFERSAALLLRRRHRCAASSSLSSLVVLSDHPFGR